MKRHIIIFALVISLASFSSSFGLVSNGWSKERGVDNSLFDALLKSHVKSGRVDYKGFKNDENKLDQYLEILEHTNVNKLSRNDRFAFYINAYNAWTIKLILTGYPGITSIKELARWPNTPWKKKICRINGEVISLDDIEHKILRPAFEDPRVHFAINCASISCPPLRPEPYTGTILEQQLDDAAQSFINNPEQNFLDGKKLYASRIFKWFSNDFKNDIVGFFITHAQGNFKKELAREKDKIKIKYLKYDWSLNGE